MKQLLMTPGPTPVPQKIAGEMAQPIIHHRTPEYREIFKDVMQGLKTLFKTSNDCLVFASSGTGAMEASVVNLLSPGDKAVAIRGGKFGERYYEICKGYNIDVIPMDIEWGASPDPKALKNILKKNPGVMAVYTELCETSTAAVYDIKSISGIVKNSNAALVVDAISGLGADNLETDNWGVDVAVSGSQKALMLPPGLSFCTVSKKAWDMVKTSKTPKYYYDFNKYKKSAEANDTPFTSAITLTIGLKKSLDSILERGVDNVLADSALMAEKIRKSAKEMNLKVFSTSPSNAVTALSMPKEKDAGLVIKSMKAKGITIAGGQGKLKGKIVRIAHMGAITMADVDRTIETLKEVL